MKECDVVVVGGGAAGLRAALVLVRARRKVVVVDAGAPRNAPAAHMHGFLSRDGMAPRELLAAGRAEVSGYGGRLIDDTVVAIEPGFQVRLANGAHLRTRRILVATGLRELPDLPGVWERWGRDLLHCPYCHGYEVRDQPLGVLGGAPEAVQHALLVRQWSPDVVLFPHTDAVGPEQREHLTARGIRIVDGTIARLVVDHDQLQGVELDGGTVVPRTAVFVRPRFVPNADLLTGLGCEVDAHGWGTTIRSGAPASLASGSQATPLIPAPRSSAQLEKGQPRRSRSTPTWSMRTSSAPSRITAPTTRRPRQRFPLQLSEELLGRGDRWCRWAGLPPHGHRWARYATSPRDQRVWTQDPVRAEVTAYQDGVWLGRAIVPVDAIAPGEAPPECD